MLQSARVQRFKSISDATVPFGRIYPQTQMPLTTATQSAIATGNASVEWWHRSCKPASVVTSISYRRRLR